MMEMIEVKTSELIGAGLDWAVAQATEAWNIAHKWFPTMTLDPTFTGVESFEFSTTGRKVCRLVPNNPFRQDYQIFSPSTEWEQGGALIDRHLKLLESEIDEWGAMALGEYEDGPEECFETGPTALVAACRAIVAAKLGETVSVPADLVAQPTQAN
jgi:hypothetical protein